MLTALYSIGGEKSITSFLDDVKLNDIIAMSTSCEQQYKAANCEDETFDKTGEETGKRISLPGAWFVQPFLSSYRKRPPSQILDLPARLKRTYKTYNAYSFIHRIIMKYVYYYAIKMMSYIEIIREVECDAESLQNVRQVASCLCDLATRVAIQVHDRISLKIKMDFNS